MMMRDHPLRLRGSLSLWLERLTTGAARCLPLLSLAAGVTGCLVTSSPDFSDTERSRPQLLTLPIDTPTTELMPMYKSNGQYTPLTFRAHVLSEDAGEPLQGRLLIDYGVLQSSNEIYSSVVEVGVLQPGTLADGPREIYGTWDPDKVTENKCRTVTLIVTHQFWQVLGKYYCPVDLNDYDTLTWIVPSCGEATDGPESCVYDCPSTDDSIPVTDCEALADEGEST